MDKELAVVVGMSLSYVASLAGMFVAVWAYKKNEKRRKAQSDTKDGGSQEPSTLV